jgi:hypothetical protein
LLWRRRSAWQQAAAARRGHILIAADLIAAAKAGDETKLADEHESLRALVSGEQAL